MSDWKEAQDAALDGEFYTPPNARYGSPVWHYLNGATQLRWEVWQAALASQAEAESLEITPLQLDEWDQRSVDIIKNLALSVRRLCHRLNKHEPESKMIDQALAYLRGENLQGSILREASQAEAGWISVDERLPERAGNYYVWSKNCREVWEASFNPHKATHKWNYMDVSEPGDEDTLLPGETNAVTHWRELPAPPEVKEKK
jgi:hypothetical protein